MRKIVSLLAVLLLAAACTNANDSASDSASAQSLQPALAGYQVQNVDNVIDTFAATAGATATRLGRTRAAVAGTGLGAHHALKHPAHRPAPHAAPIRTDSADNRP